MPEAAHKMHPDADLVKEDVVAFGIWQKSNLLVDSELHLSSY